MTSTFYRAHEGGEATIRLVTDYHKRNIFPCFRDFHVNSNTTEVMQLQNASTRRRIQWKVYVGVSQPTREGSNLANESMLGIQLLQS